MAGHSTRISGADVEHVHIPPGLLIFHSQIQCSKPALVPAQRRYGGVIHHILFQHKPLRLTLLRHDAEACTDGLSDVFETDGFPFQQNLSCIHRIRTDDCPQDLGPSGPRKAGDSQNLASAQFKGVRFSKTPFLVRPVTFRTVSPGLCSRFG